MAKCVHGMVLQMKVFNNCHVRGVAHVTVLLEYILLTALLEYLRVRVGGRA